MLKLTPRQAEILAFIKRCLVDNGYPPTRAEIAQELGKGKIVVMNLCGRGDKDIFTVAEALGRKI